MKKKFVTVQDMALIALFAALIAVCSWISIPLGPVPFTLQTFAVFATAGLLGAKRGTITIVVYMLIGLAGVPVFTGFKGGVAVLAGPTGGYIIGFVFTTLIIGIVADLLKKSRNRIKMLLLICAMMFGDIVCFAVGTIQFMYVMNMNMAESLALCVIPYIIPDIVKILVAAVIVNRVEKYI